MVRIILFVGLLVGLAWWLTPPGADVSGSARVVDGDTFWIGNTKIRIFGIDAPEASDALGPAATNWMRTRVSGKSIACERRDTDRYGRMVAVCREAGRDLAAEITEAGLATAYRRFLLDYVDEEDRARASEIGIWAATVRPAPAQGCQIKGNISANGQIFHVPGNRSYSATKIDTTRGERWFCTVVEAQAAGWRAARR